MNCTESRRLMHLDRPGERSERETRAWLAHLTGCTTCASEARSVARLHQLEQSLREAPLPVPDLTVVRARVLAATTRTERRSSLLPTARLAYAIALVAAVAWFGTDQWRLRTAHAGLVQRTSEPPPATVGPQIVYTVDASTARQLSSHVVELQPALTTHGALEVPQATALQWLERTPSHLVMTLTRQPVQQAQITKAFQILQSAVEVTIRYRSKGA